eukprot:2231496-Amphidinium_carterae.2
MSFTASESIDLILTPGRAKRAELRGAVERSEDLVRRYCVRKDTHTGAQHTLSEDIRTASLEKFFFLKISKSTCSSKGRVWMRSPFFKGAPWGLKGVPAYKAGTYASQEET